MVPVILLLGFIVIYIVIKLNVVRLIYVLCVGGDDRNFQSAYQKLIFHENSSAKSSIYILQFLHGKSKSKSKFISIRIEWGPFDGAVEIIMVVVVVVAFLV